YTARSTIWSAIVKLSSRRARTQAPPALPRLSIRSASPPPRRASTASPANPRRARVGGAVARRLGRVQHGHEPVGGRQPRRSAHPGSPPSPHPAPGPPPCKSAAPLALLERPSARGP